MVNSFDYATDVSKGAAPPWNLLVVDDQKIRLTMFAGTATLLKKINKLSRDYEAFQNQDQRLYEDWYNLTFRHERQQEESVDRRLQHLRMFKTHIEYITETSEVSSAEAYRLLQDEEQQYQSGDADWRFVIEMLRKQRFENAQKIKARSVSIHISSPSTGDLFTEESTEQPGVSALTRKERTTLYFLKETHDEVLAQRLNDSKIGFTLFKESFQVALKSADWSLLAKLWKCSHRIFQERLLKNMPEHLHDFLNQMLTEHGKSLEVHNCDPQADEIFVKTTYRKLVRLLHPDSVVGFDNFEKRDWIQKMWQKVQDAYLRKDVQKLKFLDYMVVLQLGHLNTLTMDEIYESSLLFAGELENLKKKIKAFRKHPAWNFSSRRGYESLTIRTRQELQGRINSKLGEAEVLEAWLAAIAQ